MDTNYTSYLPQEEQRPHPAGDANTAELRHALYQAQVNLLRYRELFDFAPDAYLITDPLGLILEGNHAAAALLGTPKPFLAGKPLLFYVAESDHRDFANKLNHLPGRSSGQLQWEMALTPRGAAGPLHVLVSVCSSSADEEPRTLRWELQDITSRHRAQENLCAEHDFAESLIELADAVILVLDPAGRVVRANRFVTALTAEPRKLEGRTFPELLVAEDQVAAQKELGRLDEGCLHVAGVHRLRTKDGPPRTVAWSARRLLPGPDRHAGTLIVGSDITALQEAQRRALQAERLASIGEMIAGLAHESRNALQRGVSCLAMLRFRLQDQPDALSLLDRAQQAQTDLHRLYENVREYAAPINPTEEVCDLAAAWREAWQDLIAARTNRQAALREELEVADTRCQASSFRLKQVFRNLLDNALGAIDGPVLITIRCTEAQLDGRAAIQVAVRDNGPGLPEAFRARAFEPFATTKPQGTGLGLAICKRIVEAHGGRIALGEAEGPGAVFVLTLPRGKA